MKKTLHIVLVLLLTMVALAGCTNDYEAKVPPDEASSREAGQESVAQGGLPGESDASGVKTGESMAGTGRTTSGAKTSDGMSGGQNITSKAASGKNTPSGSTATVPSGSNKIEAAENNGEVAYYDGWIYYLITNTPRTNNYNLYKMRADGTERIKLIDARVGSFYVADGWIYFSNGADNGAIYKMKTDGSEKVKLSSDASYYAINIIVADGWIYWIDINKHYSTFYGEIWRMRTDGTEQQQFRDPANIGYSHACSMAVVNGWIYYIHRLGSSVSGINWNAGYLSKMRTDGTSRSRIHEAVIDFYTVENDWIFYCNVSDRGKIYKMRTDGTGEIKIDNNGAFSINIFDNWIYYCGPMDRGSDSAGKPYKIYKMRKDGTEIKEIDSDALRAVRVVNGWLYCIRWDWSMYRIRTDGTDKQQIQIIA